MHIEIKKITEQQYPVLLDMIKEFAAFLGKSEKVKMTVEDLSKGKEYFECFFIEGKNNEVMGYAFTYFTFHTWTGKTLYLEDIYIKEEYRGKSVGNAVMEKLMQYAKENKCTGFNWQVLDWNENAIRFYKKIGAKVGDNNLNCNIEIKF